MMLYDMEWLAVVGSMVSKEDLNVRFATFDDGDGDDDEEIYGGSEFSSSVELLLDLVW